MSGKMPGKKPDAANGTKEKKKGEGINRGTTDEMEIVGIIIANHAGLRTVVFDRLRQARARQKTREEVLKRRGGADDKAS